MVRLAVIMLGDQATAEDVVQDAFLALYRRWDSLAEVSNPLAYVRTSVLNGCRSVLRRRTRNRLAAVFSQPPSESGQARALVSEEYRAVVTAIRRLPSRQREALLLRYYIDMSEDEIARTMGTRALGPHSQQVLSHVGTPPRSPRRFCGQARLATRLSAG